MAHIYCTKSDPKFWQNCVAYIEKFYAKLQPFAKKQWLLINWSLFHFQFAFTLIAHISYNVNYLLIHQLGIDSANEFNEFNLPTLFTNRNYFTNKCKHKFTGNVILLFQFTEIFKINFHYSYVTLQLLPTTLPGIRPYLDICNIVATTIALGNILLQFIIKNVSREHLITNKTMLLFRLSNFWLWLLAIDRRPLQWTVCHKKYEKKI